MNTRNGLATKLISVVASLALVVGLMPLPAFAETASSQRLTLAAGELATTTGEPDAGDSGGSGYGLINGIPASDEGYVWIDSAGDSIRWHVIGANDSNYLLISADLLGDKTNWQGAKNYCNALFSTGRASSMCTRTGRSAGIPAGRRCTVGLAAG